MLVSKIGRNGSIFSSEGLPLPHFRGGGSLYGQNFKSLLEGWCLQQSCRVGQEDKKYAKNVSKGSAPTSSRGVNTQKNRYRRAELWKSEFYFSSCATIFIIIIQSVENNEKE